MINWPKALFSWALVWYYKTMKQDELLFRIHDQREAARAVVYEIPESFFSSSTTTFADLAMGGGQYLAEVLKRCEKYHSREQILPRLFGFETNKVYITCAIRYNGLRGANISTASPFELTMKFDVIIGNPPYQRPKHAEGNKDNRPLWIDFLKKSGELLSDGGWMSQLVPGQVAKSTRWDEAGKGFKALEWGNITSIKTGMEEFFNVGSLISQVTATTGKQGAVNVNGIKVDLKKRPWLPLNPSSEAFCILDKISSQSNPFDFKLGLGTERIDPELSIGFWRLNQNYGFTPQFSSDRDLTKKMMWIGCDVASREDGEKLIELMKSKLFTAFRRITFYEPNYAHLLLSRLTFPDIIPTEDSEIYKAYGLTSDEIKFVESFCR